MTMSTLYTLPIYAKKTCTGLLCALGMVFLTSVAFGQTAGFQSEIGDLSGKEWKSGTTLTATIAEEKSNAQAHIAMPDVHPDDKGILTFYVEVLNRLESHVQASMPINDGLVKAFDETVTLAVNNAALKMVEPQTVYPLMQTLVERLQVVPVFIPASY